MEEGGGPQISVRVIKYGSSVLRSFQDVGPVADDILSQRGDGEALLIVVSAFEGRTQRLIEEARMFGFSNESADYAAHVCVGEYETAGALLRALKSRRIEALLATPDRLGFVAAGPRHDAEPVDFNADAARDLLRATPIIILPGYCATDSLRQPVLLGRGGSDLSAVYAASRLGAVARLIKDVGAVYDSDPRLHKGAAKLDHLSYEAAMQVAGKLIQPKALEWAAAHGVTVEIAALGLPPGTTIGRAT